MIRKDKTDPNSLPLDFGNEALLNFLEKEAIRTEGKRDDNASMSSQVELNLCGQLMLLSTVLLTGSVVWFGSKDVTSSLTLLQTGALLLMFMCLFTSISAGIKYYFVLSGFFQKWAESEDKVSDVFRDKEFATWGEVVKKIKVARKGLDNLAERKWLWVQIILLGLAVLSLFSLVCGVLFDFTWLTR
jgi:hypothetical protein